MMITLDNNLTKITNYIVLVCDEAINQRNILTVAQLLRTMYGGMNDRIMII